MAFIVIVIHPVSKGTGTSKNILKDEPSNAVLSEGGDPDDGLGRWGEHKLNGPWEAVIVSAESVEEECGFGEQ